MDNEIKQTIIIMRKNIILIYLFIALLSTSCNNKMTFEENNIPRQNIVSQHFSLDKFIYHNKEVLETLYPDLLAEILAGEVTVTETYFTNEMYAQIHEGTEIVNLDTLFVIDNFSNNKGFLIYSEWYGIVAISDNGNIDISQYTDVNFNTENQQSVILHEIFSLIDMNALYIIRHGTPLILPEENFVVNRKSTTDTLELFRPLSRVNLDQDYPWDYYVNIEHPNCPVGCGPVAICTMFSAFKYPSIIDDLYGNWDEIIRACNLYNNSSHHDVTENIYIVAKWLLSLGRLSAHTTLGTATGWLEMKHIIDDYPLYTDLEWIEIDNEDDEQYFIDFIKNKKMPIIMYAADLNCIPFALHYFVLDGVAEIDNTIEITWNNGHIDTICSRSYPLVHCNWGYGGQSNGYFRYNNGIDLSERIMRSGILSIYESHRTLYMTDNYDGGVLLDRNVYRRDRKVLSYNYLGDL